MTMIATNEPTSNLLHHSDKLLPHSLSTLM